MHGSETAWLQTPSSHLEELCLSLPCQEWAKCWMDGPVPPPKVSASAGPPPLPCSPDPSSSPHPRSTAQATHLSHDKGEAATGKRTTMCPLHSIKMSVGRSHNQNYKVMNRWRDTRNGRVLREQRTRSRNPRVIEPEVPEGHKSTG